MNKTSKPLSEIRLELEGYRENLTARAAAERDGGAQSATAAGAAGAAGSGLQRDQVDPKYWSLLRLGMPWKDLDSIRGIVEEVEWTRPLLMVMGGEKDGKSALLRRLSTQLVLPSSTRRHATRLPILFRMRRPKSEDGLQKSKHISIVRWRRTPGLWTTQTDWTQRTTASLSRALPRARPRARARMTAGCCYDHARRLSRDAAR